MHTRQQVYTQLEMYFNIGVSGRVRLLGTVYAVNQASRCGYNWIALVVVFMSSCSSNFHTLIDVKPV